MGRKYCAKDQNFVNFPPNRSLEAVSFMDNYIPFFVSLF